MLRLLIRLILTSYMYLLCLSWLQVNEQHDGVVLSSLAEPVSQRRRLLPTLIYVECLASFFFPPPDLIPPFLYRLARIITNGYQRC